MIVNLLSATLVVRLLAPATALPDPCQLVTAAQVKAMLGKTPGKGTVTKPEYDKVNQASSTMCSMEIGEELLMITVAEFATAAGANKTFTAIASDPDLGVKMTLDSGLGEKAAWGARPDALWIVLKGRYLLNLMIATANADGTPYREPLKRLNALALGKL